MKTALALAAAAVGAIAVLLASRIGGSPSQELAPLPAPPEPAFAVPPPTALEEPSPAARWTVVLRSVAARAAPLATADVRGPLAMQTPEGTANVVLVLGRHVDAHDELWIKVAIPGLPAAASGWVPRSSLGAYHAVRTRLVVDLERQTATLLRDGRSVFRAPVGVGTPAFPTPRGEFFVRSRLTDFASAFYGPLAFATSARSPNATDWPGGGVVGIHGTDRPGLLPGRVSHGCIRLRNDDILRLGHLMSVGTPITIR